ncbi:hypothetical protein EMIT0P100_10615 [Pseudomonas sp. IT-P100]
MANVFKMSANLMKKVDNVIFPSIPILQPFPNVFEKYD